MRTAVLPEYIFQNKDKYKIIQTKNIILAKSNRLKKDKICLRNSMHLMILLLEGGKILHLKDKDEKIDNSKILFLSQNSYFMTEFLGKKDKFESILIYFNDEAVLNFIKKYDISLKKVEDKYFLNLDKNSLLDLSIKSLNQYFDYTIENQEYLAQLKFEELLLYSYSKDKEAFSGFLNTILKTKPTRIKLILESNIDILQSVEQMCKITRLNQKALRVQMQKMYKQNPKQWLDNQRLLKAQNLLRNSDETISSIATSCGYSTVSWFINQFKKKFDCTPFEYRNKNL